MLLAAALPAIGFAQTASESETKAVLQIAECLADGPPQDWQQLFMVIELPEAGSSSGRARYLVSSDFAPDPVPYIPCDGKKPAQILMDARSEQPAERRGWTGARLVIHRSGRFDLNYDYPK
ncbi:MAG TPA: hypothetical protein VM183_20515 [Burkholderiales bacterium]|nr:hypothetical protein [Burkholderiales bacterium]